MPLPSLSPEQRAAALEKAAEIRKARAELKDQLKSGKTSLAEVLGRAEGDDDHEERRNARREPLRLGDRHGRFPLVDPRRDRHCRRVIEQNRYAVSSRE